MGKTNKTILEMAKDLITKLASNTELAKGEDLVYETLEVGIAVMIGEDVAPDGDYMFEDGSTVIVKDGVIAEIVAVEVEAEKADEDKDVEVKAEEVVEDVVEKPSDNLSLDGLATMLNVQPDQNSFGSISFEVVNGVVVWGELSACSYKTLMSANDSNEAKVKALELEKAEFEKTILELSEAVRSNSKLNQAPVKAETNKISRVEMLRKGRK